MNRQFGCLFVVLIILAAGAFASMRAFADDKTFSWIAPTTWSDTLPLDPLQDLEQYQLGCGPTTGDRTTFLRTWFDPVPTTRVETFAVRGNYFCALRVKAVSTQGGAFSAWSNEVNFSITAEPNAPSGLAVN